jgi:hypothetical protein
MIKIAALVALAGVALAGCGGGTRTVERVRVVNHTHTHTVEVAVSRPPYWRVEAPAWCQEDMI